LCLIVICLLVEFKRGLFEISFSTISICFPPLVNDFLLNAIVTKINNNATKVIVANTVDQDVQPLKKLNLFAGHTLVDDVDILEEPRAIVLGI
jgi:hypothetical protein